MHTVGESEFFKFGDVVKAIAVFVSYGLEFALFVPVAQCFY